MKALRCFAAAAMMLLIMLSVTGRAEATNSADVVYTEVDEVVYATTGVNVRSGPGTNYTWLGTLEYGQSIRRTAIGSNGWSKVLYNGQTAYMTSEYISPDKPSSFESGIDETALREQMAIANGLHAYDYTKESWLPVQNALNDAESALRNGNQKAADKATEALKKAIAALVKVDYTLLQNSLQAAKTFAEDDKLNQLHQQLEAAVAEGEKLLTSGDQAAVNASAVELYELLVAIRLELEGQTAPEIIVQPDPEPALPTGDYCNISTHRLWQVLFFVALAMNVVFSLLIIFYVRGRQKVEEDDTPLVDYDIDDDTF